MKLFIKIIASFLAIISISSADPSTSKNVESRTDGLVNIGGVLYPEDEMKDPEKRRKAELVAEQVAKMRDIDQHPRDYANARISELLPLALGTMNNNTWDAALKELSKRPEETKTAICNFLKNENPLQDDLLFFSRLPSVAKVLGTEYEVDVTKKILNHPLAKKHDHILFEDQSSSMPGGGLFNHLALSDKDETEILEGLIAEGRVERGSELEIKWRKLLSQGVRSEKIPMRSTTDGNNGNSDSNQGNKISKGSFDGRDDFLPIAIALCVLLVALGLLLWRKVTRSTNSQKSTNSRDTPTTGPRQP